MRWLMTGRVRSRVLFTLFMVVLFTLGTFVPLPFVEPLPGFSASSVSNLLNLTSGGALSRFGFLALGISPYITASIVVQLLQKSVPALKRLSEQGVEGRVKLAQLSRLLTVVFGFSTACGVLFQPGLSSTIGVRVEAGVVGKLVLAFVLTAGCLFSTWLAERVNEKGVGQGASVLIGFGIISGLPYQVWNVYGLYGAYARDGKLGDYWFNVTAVLVLFVAIGVACVFVNRKEYRFPIQSKVNRYRVDSHFFGIKLLASSVMPVIFASALLTVLGLVDASFGFGWVWVRHDNWLGFMVYSGLILLLSFIYNYVQVDGDEIAKNFGESGIYFIGVPNCDTARFVNRELFKVTLRGAPVLAVIATVAIAVEFFVPASFGLSLTGVSLLIVVGVVQEIVFQVKGLTGKHHYKEIL